MHRLNGVPVENGATAFDLADRGLTLGDGLFETIAVFGGRPALLDAHLDRLATAAEYGDRLEQAVAESEAPIRQIEGGRAVL
ncbi:hypothetical protein ACIKTA_15470, partial [Hansschlegelia beijingensis]